MTGGDRAPQATPAHAGAKAIRRGAARSPVSVRWFALVVAMLLAFTGQSIVTQTHIHLDGGPIAASATLGVPQQTAKTPSTPDRPATCPICRQTARAGQYLAADPIAVVPPLRTLPWLVVPALAAWSGRRLSHAWHSRGPPQHRAIR